MVLTQTRAGPVAAAHEDVTDIPDKGNPLQQRRQVDVQAHVAVEDVAEFMGDDALQLVAPEMVDGATGDSHYRVGGGEAGGEGIDAALIVQHINRRYRHIGRQCHFLDHIEAAALGRVAGGG